MYCGLAIRMAQELRLGKEYHQKQLPREREIRRRTMWTCFTLDRLLSFITSRPQTIQSRQLSMQLPCPEKCFLFDEDYRGPSLSDFPNSSSEQAEVLHYFLKAVDLWGVMIDLFATIGNTTPKGPTDYEDEFFKADLAVKDWISRLPTKMKWSTRNYRTFRLLGEGTLFVSMHFLLNHALCVLHQAYLPQAGTWVLPTGSDSQEVFPSQDIAATCLHHASELTKIANSLHNGDAIDREILRSPFAGVAMVSAACVHLWSLHVDKKSTKMSVGGKADQTSDDISASEKLLCLNEVLRLWQTSWPIAVSWSETIDLVSALYGVAYGRNLTVNLDQDGTEDGEEAADTPSSPGNVALGSPNPAPYRTDYLKKYDTSSSRRPNHLHFVNFRPGFISATCGVICAYKLR